MENKEFVLGIGQSYDIFFGADDFRNNPDKKLICGEIIYQDAQTTYREVFEIDFEKYGTIFSVNSMADDLHTDLKKQITELKNIATVLNGIQNSLDEIALNSDNKKRTSN